jgi:hypothetical protein
MKCLTVAEPWATAIIRLGKSIENRAWPTRHRGPLLIHAGKSRRFYDAEDPEEWPELYGVKMPAWESLIPGAIIGAADLVACPPLTQAPRALRLSPWAEGLYLWILERPRALKQPIPWRGCQGLWTVPDNALRETLTAFGHANLEGAFQ